MSAKPITPGEAARTAGTAIPDDVVEVFNGLIARHYRDGRSSFKFKEAAALISEKLGITTTQVYERHLLDVEGLYRAAGWDVREDKPAYNESYEGYWEFKRKGKS